MKIICAGYWKTGTKSLAQALRILGYRVYDYDDQLFELGELWDKFHNGTVTDDEIYSSLKDIDVLIDGPTIAFWEEIHKVFPDAEIILTTRDKESWYKSYKGMQDAISLRLTLQLGLSLLFPAGITFHRRRTTMLTFCQGIDGQFSLFPAKNERLHRLKFRKHNSYVLHRAPRDKLLIHRAKDGWRPLCEFLGYNIPDEPYPFRNKANALLSFNEGPLNPQFEKLIKRSKMLFHAILVALTLAICYTFSIFPFHLF